MHGKHYEFLHAHVMLILKPLVLSWPKFQTKQNLKKQITDFTQVMLVHKPLVLSWSEFQKVHKT